MWNSKKYYKNEMYKRKQGIQIKGWNEFKTTAFWAVFSFELGKESKENVLGRFYIFGHLTEDFPGSTKTLSEESILGSRMSLLR